MEEEKHATGIQGSVPSEKGGTASVNNKNAHAKDQEKEEKQTFDESSTMSSSVAITARAYLEESKQ